MSNKPLLFKATEIWGLLVITAKLACMINKLYNSYVTLGNLLIVAIPRFSHQKMREAWDMVSTENMVTCSSS